MYDWQLDTQQQRHNHAPLGLGTGFPGGSVTRALMSRFLRNPAGTLLERPPPPAEAEGPAPAAANTVPRPGRNAVTVPPRLAKRTSPGLSYPAMWEAAMMAGPNVNVAVDLGGHKKMRIAFGVEFERVNRLSKPKQMG